MIKWIVLATFLACGSAGGARADVGIGAGALVGTGVNFGDSSNHPYRASLGAYGELDLGNFMLGVRGTRSFADTSKCDGDCTELNGIRSFGLDLGYIWHLPLLHVGPRLGGGWARERHVERYGAYIEPGASLDVRLSVFNVGAEVRYRFVTTEPEMCGLLAYLRLGIVL